ncbi:MAG: hypothetical protein D6797_05435 [Bdellovibrio sp.]|nr:MAG: hypothetical protein D6797_05435 [Bdellovibrio sp.]
MFYFNRFYLFFLGSLFFLNVAYGEILFEGYYRILASKKPIGYFIQRYEFLKKEKIFSSKYYIYANNGATQVTESLKAQSTSKFEPLQYAYTSVVKGVGQKTAKVKMIDVKFKKGRMVGFVANGRHRQQLNTKIEKGVFLSTFLGYMMLKKGLSPQRKFSYKAIAEEEAQVFPGTAVIVSEEKFRGIPAFKILNTFKNSKFVSYLSTKGEVLFTFAPLQQVNVELVDRPLEATKSFPVPQKTLKALFGQVPLGKKHQPLSVLPKKPSKAGP